MDKITKAIKDGQRKQDVRQAALEARLKKLETGKEVRISVPGTEYGIGKDQFSLFRAFQAIKDGNWSGAEYEREVFDETRKRVLAANVDAAGGYWIPEEVSSDFIEVLYANMITKALGARVMSGLTHSPIAIPGMSGSATAYWVGTNEKITLSTQSSFRRQLQYKKVAAIVAVDNELMRLGVPSAEKIVLDDMAEVLALAIDIAAITGTGVNGQPLGLVNDPDVDTSVAASSGALTHKIADDMVGILEDGNALKGSLGFAMAPAVKRALKEERIANYSGQTDGMYLYPPIVSDAALASSLGYKFETTTQLASTLAIFANWADLIIGQWGGIEIAKSDAATDGTSYAFTQDQTWFRVTALVDSLVRRPASFSVCDDIVV